MLCLVCFLFNLFLRKVRDLKKHCAEWLFLTCFKDYEHFEIVQKDKAKFEAKRNRQLNLLSKIGEAFLQFSAVRLMKVSNSDEMIPTLG